MFLHYRVDVRIQFTDNSFCTLLCKKSRLLVESGLRLVRRFSNKKNFEKCWAHSPLRAVLHCHSPGVATVERRTLPARRCPRQRRRQQQQQQRQRMTKGTAMAPWNGPNKRPSVLKETVKTDQNCDGLTKSRNAQTYPRQVHVS